MALFVIASTYRIYVRQALEIRWRRVLTAHYLERWMSAQAYCQIQLHRGEIDNPDQRIAEDVRDFVASALGLSLSLLAAVATLVSFGGLLWGLSRDWPLQFDGTPLRIPGFMLWVAVGFSAALDVDHAPRRAAARARSTSTGCASRPTSATAWCASATTSRPSCSRAASRVERLGALARFRSVVDNWWQLIRAQRNLTLLTTGIGQMNEIVPLLVAAPAYFARLITLGKIAQTRIAYGQVSGALTWFVNAYQEIARWRANIERLSTFAEMMDATQRELAGAGIRLEPSPAESLRLRDLDLECPAAGCCSRARTPRSPRASAWPSPGRRAPARRCCCARSPASGPSAPGASRCRPARGCSSCPSGPTCRSGRCAPSRRSRRPRAASRTSGSARRWGCSGSRDLAQRLDEVEQWEQQLSPHEQQRLALARVLLHEPDWVFLDKATSALDEEMEKRVYELLAERLPRATVISVAHRPEVAAYHDRRWNLAFRDDGRVELRAA